MQDYLSVICDTNKGWKDGQNIPIEVFQKQRFLLREKEAEHVKFLIVLLHKLAFILFQYGKL